MIEPPGGPPSLIYRTSRFASTSLIAIVVVMLLSPLGEGTTPEPESPPLVPMKASPAESVSASVATASMMTAASPVNRQRPPAIANQQQPPTVTDPAVLAILESNPDTPERKLQAVVTLIDLGSPNVAAPFLDDLANGQLDDITVYELHKKFGAAAVLKIGRSDVLQPQAGEFARTMLATADRVAHDPARLTGVAADLASADAETRFRAMAELRHGEAEAAAVLIGLLADENRAAASGTPGDAVIDDDVLETALAALQSHAVAPLCGALDCPKPHVQMSAANVLTQLRSADTIKFLLPGTASDDQAVRQATDRALNSLLARDLTSQQVAQHLYAQVRELYLGKPVWRNHTGEDTRLWSWSVEDQTVTAQTYSQLQASYAAAALLSKKLHEILPRSQQATTLYVNATLQSFASERGTTSPLDAGEVALGDVSELGPAALSTALENALDEGRHLSAWAAANLLGESGDQRLLHIGGQDVAPLAAACASPDPRVRYAAANAILRLQPKISFPGSSFVIHTLGHFAATRGAPRVLIADTRMIDAQQLAGLVRMIGLKADTANYSRDMIRQAFSSPDYQAVLFDITLPNADIDLVVQQLRKDPRSAALPIGFMAPVDRLEDAENFTRRYASSTALMRPQSEEVLTTQLANLLTSAEIAPLSDEERITYANNSLAWLTQLTQGDKVLFDPLTEAKAAQQAMYVPELAAAAINFQAACGLPESQTALVDYASTLPLPAELRRQAAVGFAASLSQHGVLLTSTQVMRQYDRYNASSTSDDETISILSSILDAIESTASARNSGN
ncbi:MAG: hypothetical protein MPJ50_10685 [Pirellulales bacterium]|nr:hypothetical protein [Pirellulales bacterium]